MRFALILIVLFVSSGAHSFAQTDIAPTTDTTADVMNKFSAKMVEHLPDILAFTTPGNCDLQKAAPKKVEGKAPPQVKVYACVGDADADAEVDARVDSNPKAQAVTVAPKNKSPLRLNLKVPEKNSLFRPTRKSILEIYDDNDNPLLGLIPGGDDLGYSQALALKYTRKLNEENIFTFETKSSVYTKKAVVDDSTIDEANALKEQGVVNSVQNNTPVSEKFPINFLDLLSFKAAFEHGTHFYYRLSLEGDIRETDPTKFVPGMDTQNFWHGDWKKFGTVQYQDIDARGKAPTLSFSPGTITVPTVHVGAGGVRSGGTGKVEDVTNATVTEGYQADAYLEKLSHVSISAGADVGARQNTFGGRCELQFEAGGFVSSEGRDVIGPNSFVHVNADAKTTVLREKNGAPRINLGTGATAFYFLKTDGPGEKNLGFVQSATIESFHRLGKHGSTISPFFVLYVPEGRQSYQGVNDNPNLHVDDITRFGFRINY
jgi:hypothetical protein